MADIIGDGSWYIATDGEGIFHPVELTVGLFMGHEQPHLLKGSTEDEVYNKAFVSPTREPEGSEYAGKYVIENLTPKSEADIIAASDISQKGDYHGTISIP
jgi:hypothetical protein